MFKKKEYEEAKEMVEVSIPNKGDILQKIWEELIDHAFMITGPHDGAPLSVIRVDDIYAVLSQNTDRELEKY